MVPYPALEAERIRALHATHILDSAPAPAFDAVVSLVRDLMDLPICLVSLVDTNRQWFKAKCGVDLEGTDRTLAFCNYALLSDDVLVIEDARMDARFRDNPLVTGDLHIRCYAGAPLLAARGVAIGTLCVLGTRPRKMAASEIEMLQRLAQVVMGLIRGHSLAHDAARLIEQTEAQSRIVQDQARTIRLRERRFLQAERIARIGAWETDLLTTITSWSDETYRIFDIPVGTPIDRDLALSTRPPGAGDRLDLLVERTLKGEAAFDDEFEFVTGAGARKWVRSVGEVEFQDGRPERLFGTYQDVTERHRAEDRLWTAANRDSLTGLANRNRFDEVLGSTGSEPDAIVGMLMVDADHLKDINDTLGHDAGDELIRTIAVRLRQAVGRVGTVARVGGDEFAILFPAPCDADALANAAGDILSAMQPPHLFKGSTLKPMVSIGGALRVGAQSGEDMRQAADLALYHAKENSRGGYVFFHPNMKTAITARTVAISVVDQAIDSGHVCAFYQPIFELATGGSPASKPWPGFGNPTAPTRSASLPTPFTTGERRPA